MNNPVDKILERIKTKRLFSENTLQMQEQSFSEIRDEALWKLFQSLNPDELKRLGLSLDVGIEDGFIQKKVRSTNIIGTAKLSSDVGSISMIIEPKVSSQSLVSILEFLDESPFSNSETSQAYSGIDDILTLQISRCIQLIEKSFSSGSIRGYRDKSEELPFLKGRADIHKLVEQSYWRPVGVKISCEFSDLTVDTDRNRIFKLALLKSSKVLSQRGKKQLFNRARLALYNLANVKNIDATPADFFRLVNKYPKDRAAILACRDVIQSISVSAHPGQARTFFCYALNMAHTFQKYSHKIMTSALKKKDIRPSKILSFPVFGSDCEIFLDGLFESKSTRVLIECKYKEITKISDINRADIYQAIAYSCHSDVRPNISFLLFPASGCDEAVSYIGSISGFDTKCKSIHVLTIGLSRKPKEVINSLISLLNTLFGK